MKTLRTSAKILTIILLVSLMLTLASCDMLQGLLGGSLELKSFTVDRSSVKTVYIVGEEIDFSGIKATVKYTDSALDKEYTFAELTITYDDDITATPGTKTVTVSFMDPNLNVKQETTVQITVNEDPNAPKHKEYAVDFSGMKTTYFVGDEIDFTGVKVIEKFTNGGADVEMTDTSKIAYDYDASITATTGTKNIIVTYGGESAGVISITVKHPAITEVALDTSKVTTDYMVGGTVDFSELSATVTYETGDTETVTDFQLDLTNVDMTTVGEKIVTVKFTDPVSGAYLSENITIKVDGITGYTVDTSALTLEYFENDTYSFEDIKVTAHYYYASDVELSFSDITLVHEDNLTATPGQKTVEVKVGDTKVGEFTVAVGDIIARPVVNEGSADLSYRVGETVDLSGLTITVSYSDPDKAPVTVAYESIKIITSLADLTNSGTENGTSKQITVSFYDEVTESTVITYVNIKVYSPTYSITSNPTKTVYYQGDVLDYTGLEVTASYKDGGESVIVDSSKITYSDSGITDSWASYPKMASVYANGVYAGAVTFTVNKNEIVSAVVGGSYDSSYEVDETVNFTGLTVTVTYKNGKVVELSLDKLTVGTVNTSTAGTKTVNVTFTDEVNNEEASTSFTVTVIDARPTVTQFEKDGNLTSFASDNKNAGTLDYGQTGFSGQFLNGNILYVIGDDNEFRLNPLFAVLDGGSVKSLTSYYTDVEIYLHNGTEYVALTKTPDPSRPTEVSYYNGSTLFAVVDTYNGLYSFKSTADQIKISVLPSSEHYVLNNNNPVTLEAKIIDAYNVYEAWQLAVIDNYTERTDWDTFKTDKGINGLNPAGIVLHSDIHISASDVPASFFNTSTQDVVYTKTVNGVTETSIAPAGTKYLIDGTNVYRRTGSSDFKIEGNFFTIDTRNFPLIASPVVFDADLKLDYGSDYSNATLFMFEGTTSNWTVVTSPKISIDNIAFIGNAARDNWVDSNGNLVTAGGLILVKSSRCAMTTLTNTVNNSFFIAFFPDFRGQMTVNSSKCYDSYQNAAFVWADSELTVDGSYINGSGGPVIISQSVEEDGVYYNPVTNITGSEIETHVTGEEVWFKAVNATSLVGDIKALGDGLNSLISVASDGAYSGNWVDSDRKMNIKAILMPRGSSTDALKDVMIEGTVSIDGTGIDRWYEGENASAEWGAILQHDYFALGAAFITAYDASGTTHTLIYTGQGDVPFTDLAGNVIGTDASHQAIIAAFATADQVVLHQGGLSVVFEFYH